MGRGCVCGAGLDSGLFGDSGCGLLQCVSSEFGRIMAGIKSVFHDRVSLTRWIAEMV